MSVISTTAALETGHVVLGRFDVGCDMHSPFIDVHAIIMMKVTNCDPIPDC